MENISVKNANRFLGFADTYENARPKMPIYPVKIIKQYLLKNPDTVVDLGCGTGLSTMVWLGNCKKAIGVEPSDDMINRALSKQNETIRFIKGYAHETGLDNGSVDVVVCSQSFHWMEPVSTLAEINRILKAGGIFATIDCDWPPVSRWEVDKAYTELFDKVHSIENTHPLIKDHFIRYNKNNHLKNMTDSGLFCFAREIVFSNTEICTAKRFINLVLSQGGLQDILKNAPELIAENLQNFKSLVNEIFKDKSFQIEFSYRMRIAVK